MVAEDIDPQEKSYDDLVDEINNMSIVEPADKEEESFLSPDNSIFETEYRSTKVIFATILNLFLLHACFTYR